MTKPGPSPEYRDLLEGKISSDVYVDKVKHDVHERLGIAPPAPRPAPAEAEQQPASSR